MKATEDKPGPITFRTGRLKGESVTIPALIKLLTGPAGRPIIDETGLTARYDFELKYSPELTSGGAAAGPDATPPDPNAPPKPANTTPGNMASLAKPSIPPIMPPKQPFFLDFLLK